MRCLTFVCRRFHGEFANPSVDRGPYIRRDSAISFDLLPVGRMRMLQAPSKGTPIRYVNFIYLLSPARFTFEISFLEFPSCAITREPLYKNFNLRGIGGCDRSPFSSRQIAYIDRQLIIPNIECYRKLIAFLHPDFQWPLYKYRFSARNPSGSDCRATPHNESRLCDLSIKISIKAEMKSTWASRFRASVSIACSLAHKKLFSAVSRWLTFARKSSKGFHAVRNAEGYWISEPRMDLFFFFQIRLWISSN